MIYTKKKCEEGRSNLESTDRNCFPVLFSQMNLTSPVHSFLRVSSNLYSFIQKIHTLVLKHLVSDDWLTVHRGITLVDFQPDAQNSYLFIYNIFIKILYMYMQPLVSSLSAGDCLVHRLRKNRCTRQSPAVSDDTRGCMYTIMT